MVSLCEFRTWVLAQGNIPQKKGEMDKSKTKHPSSPRKHGTKINNRRLAKITAKDAKKVIDSIRAGIPFEKIHISFALNFLHKMSKDVEAIDKNTFKSFVVKLVEKA